MKLIQTYPNMHSSCVGMPYDVFAKIEIVTRGSLQLHYTMSNKEGRVKLPHFKLVPDWDRKYRLVERMHGLQ